MVELRLLSLRARFSLRNSRGGELGTSAYRPALSARLVEFQEVRQNLRAEKDRPPGAYSLPSFLPWGRETAPRISNGFRPPACNLISLPGL